MDVIKDVEEVVYDIPVLCSLSFNNRCYQGCWKVVYDI